MRVGFFALFGVFWSDWKAPTTRNDSTDSHGCTLTLT